MSKLRFSFLTMIMCMLFMQPAEACECDLETLEIGYATRHADVVFIGMVVKIENNAKNGKKVITFRIMKSWKKPLSYRASLTTDAEELDCGFPFKRFNTYLVFATGQDDQELKTGICTRTHILHDDDSDLKYVHSRLQGF